MRIAVSFYIFLLAINLTFAQDRANIEKLLEFVKVEGGIFLMGDSTLPDATPHNVEISTFYMQKTEVTQELWKAVMGYNTDEDTISKFYPVNNISWSTSVEFIKKLNLITGKQYRLPTEAEWEYAARGGKLNKGFKYSGSDTIDEVAWFYENSGGKIHPVAE